MTNTKPITLWSLRNTAAKGQHWVAERECKSDASCWLAIFRKDEPDVTFLLRHNKPSLREF